MAVKNKSNEIKITRIYHAPIRAVWDAWTDPAQTAQWWGPRGFTLTTHHKDLRPGGSWIYTMHGPDGTDYRNVTKYFEVEECARLVYDHGGSEDRPPLFRVTATFSEHKGKTTLTMTMALPTPEEAEQTKKFIKQAGGNATWDRLAEYLEKQSSGKERFVINRTFPGSPALLYKMWTDPEHFVQWLPPTGFQMNFLRADIKTGGSTFYVMKSLDGQMVMHGKTNYIELQPVEKIIYTQEFCDENGKPSHHPGAPIWPAIMLTTVTLTAEGENETRVTVEWEPQSPVSDAEIQAFTKERAGMTLGWTGSFDKLEDLLHQKA